MVCLLVKNYNRERNKISFETRENEDSPLITRYQCVCQMFCKKEAESIKNSWKVFFTFVPSKANLEAGKRFFEEFEEYGSPIDCHFHTATIKMKILDKTDGWVVKPYSQHVTTTAVEQYTGEGEPPNIAMLITAASNETTPPDLTIEAKLKEVQKPHIVKFEKEAQNVAECVCQVFYHKEALNHWRARVAFCHKQHLEKVNQLYQDANNCSSFDVNFGGGVIKVSTDDDTVIPAGWEVTINQQCQQVTTAAVEQYTGEGEPPYCEMTLRATDSDKSALTILQPVTLIGVRQPNNTFNIERALVAFDGTPLYTPPPSLVTADLRCACQVFFHKEQINHWKATLAFFAISKSDRVKQFYQDANLGPKIDSLEFTSTVGKPCMINPIIMKVTNGWNVHSDIKKISKIDVLMYDGVGKPPYCEVTCSAGKNISTPSDLTVNVIFGDISRPTNEINISRVAETSAPLGVVSSDPLMSDDEESLPDVKILAKVNFLSRDQSSLMFSWEEYGLKLHVSERSTASFKVRVVSPRTQQLPEGTELLSPFYWVTSEGDTAGPVGIEIQHCVHITKEGLPGLGVAMLKVHEKPEPPYLFEEVEGHLSSTSDYARMEVEFSDRIYALFRKIKRILHLEKRFQARLYYYNEPSLTTSCTARIVIVPDVNACRRFVQEKYGGVAKRYVSGAEDLFYFKEEKINLALEDGPLRSFRYKNGWKITPMNVMEVTKEMANRSYTGPDSINPRMLRLEWCRDGEPQQWNEKIILTGSEDSKFLLLSQPTIDAEQTDRPNLQEETANDIILDIDKLVDVQNALKRVNDWHSLGLQLGLLYPTLEQIETDNNKEVVRCKTKMIAAWLKRQDNVLQVGVPSRSVLQTALRKIGENEIADQIVT